MSYFATEETTANWPVQERAHEALVHVAATHNVCLLRAYDEEHNTIPPNHYQRKLCGAIVQIHFTLVHYFIRQAKRSVFTTFTREMIVLHSLLPTLVNPLKRGRLSDGPLLTCKGASKKTRNVSLVPTISDISAYSCKLTFLCSFDRNPCPNARLFKEFVPNHPEKQSF